MDQFPGDLAPDRAEAPQVAPPPTPAPSLPGTPPSQRGSRWLRSAVILTALLIAAWVAWRFLGPTDGPAPGRARHGDSAPSQPVGVAKVDRGDMNVVLTGIGTVTPLATVTVETRIDGELMSVGYKEGQIVKKGDVLAQIDPRPFQVTLEQAQGALAHDSALLAQAKSDLARFVVLSRQDSIAQQQVADEQFLVKQDEGMVAEDQASVDSAELNLTYCQIVSPVTGRVGLRLVDPGNYVQTTSSTGLVVVTQLQPISVVFVLPEDDIPELMQEMQDGQTLAVSAYDRTNTKKIAEGSLITVDNTVDTTTGAVKLRASFPNTDSALFPNQFVNARLRLRTLRQVVRAPVAAVQNGAPGTFVYLVKPSGTVGVQVVKTGVTDGDEVQILSGLKSGDTVVVDGADQLRDGAKVTVKPDAGAGAATPNDGPGAPPGQQPGNSTPLPGHNGKSRPNDQ